LWFGDLQHKELSFFGCNVALMAKTRGQVIAPGAGFRFLANTGCDRQMASFEPGLGWTALGADDA